MTELTAHDRCDNGDCSAQAFVRSRTEDHLRMLDFCGHHHTKHAAALAAAGFIVAIDNRDKINKKSESSA